jgi:hypothetical protein
VHFYQSLMRDARQAITQNRYAAFAQAFMADYAADGSEDRTGPQPVHGRASTGVGKEKGKGGAGAGKARLKAKRKQPAKRSRS